MAERVDPMPPEKWARGGVVAVIRDHAGRPAYVLECDDFRPAPVPVAAREDIDGWRHGV